MTEEDPLVAEERTAEAAFEALADETRLDVLRTLVDADEDLSFSELRERTGVEDSGRFNYHLNALRDAFVTQTEEGLYSVTHAGQSIVGAVLAGRLTAGGAADPRPVDGRCIECGGDLEAAYEDTLFVVSCVDCDQVLTRSPVPPAVIEDHAEEYPDAAWRYIYMGAAQMRAGFCHVCEGPVSETFEDPGDAFPEGEDVALNWVCDRCGAGMQSTLIAGLAHDPDVRAFLADHGIDPSQDPPWEEAWLYADATTEFLSEDPERVEARLTIDNETLAVTLDENVQILDSERVTES